jgi:DNA polymerase
VDPREQLRRFLEQRRELGETEFVLDSLGVDEALRALGVGQPRGAESSRSEPATSGDAVRREWRETLRAIEAPGGTPPPEARLTRPADAAKPAQIPRPEATPVNAHASTAPGPGPVVPLEEMPTGLIVGSPSHEFFGASTSPWNSLAEIARAVGTCTRCALYRTAKNPVPGVGHPNADLVCVGEAPGATEDEQGVPFVGQAGQLLTKILAAINLSRDQVFICNVLKHRPPGNRNPLPEEVEACTPYLVRQIELLRPKVLLALGTFAAQTLLQTREPIGKLRGRIHRYYGVPLVVTYHPAALLRNPSWKRPTWEDVQLARRLLDRVAPGA